MSKNTLEGQLDLGLLANFEAGCGYLAAEHCAVDGCGSCDRFDAGELLRCRPTVQGDGQSAESSDVLVMLKFPARSALSERLQEN